MRGKVEHACHSFTNMDSMQQGKECGYMRLKLVNFEAHENHISHETLGLSENHLVVRRGKPFKLTLMFHGRSWNPYTDSLGLVVSLGCLSETIPVLYGGQAPDPQRWSAVMHADKRNHQSVPIYLCSPVLSSVAMYDLQVQLKTTLHNSWYKVGNFVLLCNPWLENDPVYMPMASHLDEYIKRDFSLIYMGTSGNLSERPWSFGQYEPGVLEACLTLLQVSPQHINNSQKDHVSRADPVYLSRVICAMVNHNDDLGVLEGKWQGNYNDGVKPTEWSSSADILRQWLSSQCRPVRYGQCWVFASVLCTVMRVLGIPSRVVTVFNSAHDSDGNTTIEEYYTSTGEKLNLSTDSIWNFHVWVECWMRRSDLGAEFDGWQVVDPTPQERSGGTFRCGPCPVAAIQRHCFSARYDTPFLYAAVDADIIQLIVKNGLVVGRNVLTEEVGSLICTKKVGSDTPENLTLTYKDPKKWQAHPGRQQMDNMLFPNKVEPYALSTRGLSSIENFQGAENGAGMTSNLEVSLVLEGVPLLGENIQICVTISNRSNIPRALMEYVNAQLKEYNENPKESFWKTSKEMIIQPQGVLVLHHTISYMEYNSILLEDAIVNIAAVVKDVNTKQRVLAAQEFSITNPPIIIEIEGGDHLTVKKQHTAMVTFTNHQSKTLMGVILSVKGSGLLQKTQEARLTLLQSGEKIEKKVTIMASSTGTKLLMATLSHSNSAVIITRSYQKVFVTAS